MSVGEHTGVPPAFLISLPMLTRLEWNSSNCITFWSLWPNWIVTTGSKSPLAELMSRMSASQRPLDFQDTVVEPLTPLLSPSAGALRYERSPSPQPPLTATVESPMRKNRGGFAALDVGLEWTRPQDKAKTTVERSFMLAELYIALIWCRA